MVDHLTNHHVCYQVEHDACQSQMVVKQEALK